jgi:UDP-MurNAc hydroxylase
MRIKYYTAAVITIEVDGLKILCDPWLYQGAFYGSWHHYPPFEFDPKEFDDIDYIYISHTHEDHLCKKSMEALNKDIPVLIHKFKSPFVKRIIERIGFNVIEIPHGERYNLTDKVHFKIFSSQETSESDEGKQTAIDTYCLISDGKHTFVNTNDNFIENIESELHKIKEEYGDIDFLAHVYTSASCYPQTTLSLSDEECEKEKIRVTKWCYDRAATLIKTLNPKYYMPFAGFYLLSGKLSLLNNKKVNSCPYEAKQYFEENYPYLLKNNKCVVLNRGEFFDIKTHTPSKEYTHYSRDDKQEYIDNVLSKIKFDYEQNQIPDNYVVKINSLLPECYNRMEKHRNRLSYNTDTDVYIKVDEKNYIFISMSGNGCYFVEKKHLYKSNKYIIMEMDIRLLIKILKGPRFAHWDNADTGSHIFYRKKPNVHERGIYHTICFFHR